MNKRSAVIVAAGLVVALTAGGLALDRGVLGPSTTTAEASGTSLPRQKPKIRTIEKTVKIHRKAKAASTSGDAGNAVSSSPGSSASWSDDEAEFEHEFEGSQIESGEADDD
jgi:hypothetical protein